MKARTVFGLTATLAVVGGALWGSIASGTTPSNACGSCVFTGGCQVVGPSPTGRANRAQKSSCIACAAACPCTSQNDDMWVNDHCSLTVLSNPSY